MAFQTLKKSASFMQENNDKPDNSSSNENYEFEILGAEAYATWFPPKKSFS